MHEVSDEILVKELVCLVATEKKTTTEILNYLSEVDGRGLWLKMGYSSMWDFCIRHLGYSEPETAVRVNAARAIAKFPKAKKLVEEKKLSLTNLSRVSKKLTKDNHELLLEELSDKSTREAERVIKTHFPETVSNKEKVRIVSETETLIQFTADKEWMELFERVKNKLLNRVNDASVKEIMRAALKEIVKEKKPRNSKTKKHTHYVRNELKRKVMEVAHEQCIYTSKTGTQCNQKAYLEVDHIQPWAMGGSSEDIKNLRILCRAHNQMKAKQDFPNYKHSKPQKEFVFALRVGGGQSWTMTKATNTIPPP